MIHLKYLIILLKIHHTCEATLIILLVKVQAKYLYELKIYSYNHCHLKTIFYLILLFIINVLLYMCVLTVKMYSFTVFRFVLNPGILNYLWGSFSKIYSLIQWLNFKLFTFLIQLNLLIVLLNSFRLLWILFNLLMLLILNVLNFYFIRYILQNKLNQE